ncbi:MAG TPA: TIR domain-containing protein [Thermoanaerobaculia bacterium]|nr:TIR domain-containing protein [Thermoanaerobaculia bacterium]
MSWIPALAVLALLLIAGSLLYFWRAARARSKVRAAEEVAWFEGRVRELRRRQDSLRARLASALALFDHYLNQRWSLGHQMDRLGYEYGPRENSFAALVETTLQHRMLGLADARHQLPYLLSLVQHESSNLEAERRFVADEAEELRRLLEAKPRLKADLEGEATVQDLRLNGLAELREAVQRELESLPRVDEHRRRLQERSLELELQLARERREEPVAFAAPSEEELLRLRQLAETTDRLRRLTEELEHESVPRLDRLEYEIHRVEQIEARWLERLESERKQMEEERLAALAAPRRSPGPTERTDRTPSRHPVLLQSLWPRRVRRAEWQTLLVYLAAGPAGLAEAEADARRRLRAPLETYAASAAAARRPIPQGTLVTVVPELPSFRFNPPFATLLWLEDWHCAEIRMQALPEAEPGKTVEGRVAFFIGPLLIGENDLEVEVVDGSEGAIDSHPQERASRTPLPGRSLAAAYRSIFVSYSHADSEIVDRLEAAYRALGDSYFRDVEILRSGETWSPALLAKIREADVFQLCWSEAARASRFVEQEWRHALGLEKERFVRPMYWRKPLPDPPTELADLHFTYVEMDRSRLV